METRQKHGGGPPGLFFRCIEFVSRKALFVAGLTYLAITGLVCFDIVARRTLGISSGSTTEITGYLMAAGMSLGLAGALMERAHVRIDVLLQKLPLGVRLALHVVSLAGLLVTAAFFAWGAASLAIDSYQLGASDLSSARVPLVVPQGIWAAGLCLMLLAVIAVLARTLRLMLIGAGEGADRALSPRSDIDEAEETLEALGRHEEAVKLHAAAQGDPGGQK